MIFWKNASMSLIAKSYSNAFFQITPSILPRMRNYRKIMEEDLNTVSYVHAMVYFEIRAMKSTSCRVNSTLASYSSKSKS
jgi:hypothetical protein